MRIALWIVPILIIFGLLSYCRYEPGSGSPTYVNAQIIFHTSGTSGKTNADPAFYVELSNGAKIYVRDWGELPASYKGPVVLQLQKGELTGQPIYRIDAQRTNVLHNKLQH